MAERLASIFGTEKDKVNCPFYFKIGACRHGDRCSRLHNKPSISQTLLIHNMYLNPHQKAVQLEEGIEVDDKETQQHFDEFYEDVFSELGSFGELEEMHVTGNLGDHLTGNLYAKFHREEDAQNALAKLNGRFYAGRPIMGEFSPVTDFREARCRQYDEGECTRGGYCNFIHPVRPSRDLVRELFRRQRKMFPHSRSRSRSRSRSPRRRSRSRSRSPRRRGGRDHRGGGGDDRRSRDYRRGDRDRRDHGDRRDRDRDRDGDRDRDRERSDRDRAEGGGDRDKDRERDRDYDRRRDDRDRERERDRDGGRDREDAGAPPPAPRQPEENREQRLD